MPNGNQPAHLARRPTLLIGYGAYGLEVLRRLLFSTVLRGVLSWQENQGAAVNDRHISDLGLLYIKDSFADEADNQNMPTEASLEMMQDLYRQIELVESSPEDLLNAVDKMANRLLDAALINMNNNSPLPLGLDVIVIVQPTSSVIVGHLDLLLKPALRAIANNHNLKQGVQSSNRLNCIQILDFNNYWEQSDDASLLRKAMHNSVSSWQLERNQARASFERFYFVDGKNANGMQAEQQRIDEITLFLEFLLFEEQRLGELQQLYQAQSNESPIATFGIRLAERSSELVSRLRAALFGIDWLDYLGKKEILDINSEPRELRDKLAPYDFEKLENELGDEDLQIQLNDHFRELEQEIVQLRLGDTWATELRQQYEKSVQELENQLTQKVHKQVKDITEERLASLSNDLKQGIEADLHNNRYPVTLGAVIHEIETTKNRLGRPQETTETAIVSSANEANQVLKSANKTYAKYDFFRQQRLKIDSFKKLWLPIFAALLSTGLTPWIMDVLAGLEKPDTLDTYLTIAYNASQTINHPVIIFLVLFILFFLLNKPLFYNSILFRLQRAENFWQQDKRGRLIGYVRHLFKPNQILRKPSEEFLKRLLSDMASTIRSEVRHNLDRIENILRKRASEMVWLRGQLRHFLNLHGIRVDAADTLPHKSTNIRYPIGQQVTDYQNNQPPTEDQFRSAQSMVNPFKGWNEAYSKTFLYPINFIDDLKEHLPAQQAMTEADITKEFIKFIKQRGRFHPAFLFHAQTGVQPQQHYCILPQSWTRLQQIQTELSDIGIAGNHLIHQESDDSRAYLLCLQTGIDSDCLIGTQEK